MTITHCDVRPADRTTTKTRVYVFTTGESVLDNMTNRRSRPHTLYAQQVMPTVLQRLGLPLDSKFRWSQRAGCSCGCSPGFILCDNRGHDVFVTVEGR